MVVLVQIFHCSLERELGSCVAQIAGNRKTSSLSTWGEQLSTWPIQMTEQLEYRPTLTSVFSQV